MFFRAPKAPARPKYRNDRAEEGRRRAGDKHLREWSFGKEIILYNARNIYTDGRDWGWTGSGDWIETAGEDFVEVSGETVFKTRDPRLVWAGWRRGWGKENDTIRPEALAVRRGDIFPAPQARAGSGGVYRTRNLREAWALWTKLGGKGARWSGDGVLDIEYAKTPTAEELRTIGWVRTADGGFLDIHTPLPEWIIRGSSFFPGHSRSSWAGVDEVKIKLSGKEGCVPSSFVIRSPEQAGRLMKGCECLPVGCRVRVDDRLSFGLFSGRCVPWMEGKVIIPARRMVPLKPCENETTIQLDRSAGARFIVNPSSIEYSQLCRARIATYLSKKGQEKCIITRSASGLRSASSVARKSIVENSNIFYRAITPLGDGEFVSRQKMAGEARAGRLPKQDRRTYDRLVAQYGDLVGPDYYQHGEAYYKEAAKQLAAAKREGYMEAGEARRASVVPADVFDRLLSKEMIPKRKISTGAGYLKPLTFADIQGNFPLIEEIVKVARDRELDWLCQIIAFNHDDFTKALLTVSLRDS